MTQNAIAYFNVEESKRSNRAHEAETQKHNRATEATQLRQVQELERHNSALEALESQRNAELARHNAMAEQLQQKQLSIQHALGIGNIELGYANVQQAYSNLAEQIRSHRAQEAEMRRSNIARERESVRHNYATEFTNAFGAQTNRISATGNLALGQSRLEQDFVLERRAQDVKAAGPIGGPLFMAVDYAVSGAQQVYTAVTKHKPRKGGQSTFTGAGGKY